jgi:5-methylthioadenosine/S-adenosylhomocysteine deaminase
VRLSVRQFALTCRATDEERTQFRGLDIMTQRRGIQCISPRLAVRWFAVLVLLIEHRTGSGQEVAPISNDVRSWAVYGSIVSETGAKDGWIVFDRGGISAVNAPPEQLPKDSLRINYDGYIFPGLIDTHNHAQWNAIPRWRAGRTFKNRYEWQADPEYLRKVRSLFYDQVQKNGAEYASLKYAEVRALVGGTTTIQSTYSIPEPYLLARKLDASYGADTRIGDITKVAEDEIHRFRTGLAAGRTRRIFLHIAEGKRDDPQSRKEFAALESKGLVRPGVVVIHGVALARQDFHKMADAGMFLVWSPGSNDVLYKETAKILDALEEKVVVALAPDWTITGSNNVLEELKVAHNYSRKCLGGKVTPRQLFRMATSDAAKVAGEDERLGHLAFGYAADLFLAEKLDPDPFQSLLKTSPRHIHLVFVDGMPIYGDAGELKKWVSTDSIDMIDVDQARKAILLKGDPRSAWHSRQGYDEVIRVLRAALPGGLAPLIEQ